MTQASKLDMMEEELKLESAYRQKGYEALMSAIYQAKENKAVDTRIPMGKAFFNHRVEDVYNVQLAWLAKQLKPKAGVKPVYADMLSEMAAIWNSTEEMAGVFASLTLSFVLNGLAGSAEVCVLSNLGYKLAKAIEYEVMTKSFANWLETQKENKNALMGIDKRIGISYRQEYLKNAMKKCGFKPKKWSITPDGREALRTLGAALIALAEEPSGYFTLEVNYVTSTELVPTPQFTEAWERNEDNMLYHAHKFCPMVIPPAPWVSYEEGGYYGDLAHFSTLLRLKDLDTVFGHSYMKRLSQLAISEVFKALNAVQATPWTINKEVLEVIKYCRALAHIPCASASGNVLTLEHDDKPVRPLILEDEKAIAEYKKKMAAWYSAEKRRISLQLRANTIINTADTYAKYDRIYFPWNMDFRGRMYPIPQFNPQGDDLCKGLLLFADVPPCQNTKDIEWLAITGANLAGVDKVSYDDRIQWVYEHEEVILSVADDPMGNMWWISQDEPVEMLAFCFEWKKAKRWIAEHGSIVGFVTGLPYAQDGTCSGLQHFSAILRDPVGGRAVNLIPQDKPNDIYAQVAEKVKVLLKKDAVEGTPDSWDEKKLKTKYGTKTLAQLWLTFGINRKVTKRPTMTLAYGAKKTGYTSQIMEDTIKKARREQKEACVFTETNSFQCAQYMAEQIWNAVGQTVVKAVEGMDWLHKCAKLVTKNASVVTWTTPMGLLLQQNYVKFETKVVKLRCAGKRFRIYSPNQTGEIDKQKQANGIAPNFIHSMDACHLQMTINNSLDAGIHHFAMIHDSYGCPMAQAALMYKIVRDTFIKMYTEHSVLDEFRECLQPLSDKTLPNPPTKGDLNLEVVRDSKYIFC